MKKYNKIKELSGENSGGKWWKMERNDMEMLFWHSSLSVAAKQQNKYRTNH